MYSVAVQVQYVNNADDEARGVIDNPFRASSDSLRPRLDRKGNGPFPGDVTVFSFTLYSNDHLKRVIGMASLTCYYNYDLNALCNAVYDLGDARGILLATGPLNFNTTRFTLAVTGGTGAYLGARGELLESRATVDSQRLAFVLVN